MNCPGENTLLDLLQEGGGPPEPALEAHLAGCAACRGLLQEAREDQSRTDTAFPEPDPQGTRVDRPSRSQSVLSNPALDPLIGQRIGEYEVLERIGAGGMGVVYRAVQPLIGKPVAIKVIRGEATKDAQLMQRMLLEARAVNAIGHRGIVDIFGFGQVVGGRHYVVMEFLQGEPLDVWLKRQPPLALSDILDLVEQILGPLGAAHRAGVIHRDLKPSNLFRVLHEDGHTALKLLDFGLAKRTIHKKGLTRAGAVVGTPAYMAPEQVVGDPVDARTDLYSLAVVVYRLAGCRPFSETDTGALMEAHLRQPPRPLRLDRPDLPEALEALLLGMLSKAPADRPSSVEEVRTALEALRPGPPAPTLESMPAVSVVRPAAAPARRRALVVGGAAVSAALAALLAVAWGLGVFESGPQPLPVAAPVRVDPEPPATPAAAQARAPSRSPEDDAVRLAAAAEPEPEAGEDEVERAEAPAVQKRPARGSARSRAAPLEEERQRLLQRAAVVRARMKQQDPLSAMFIDKAEEDARAATTRAQLRQAERTIKGVEEKFLSAGR